MRLLIPVLLFLAACSSTGREAVVHPKDAELIASFQSRKPDFEKLLELFRQHPQLQEFTHQGLAWKETRRDRASYEIPMPQRTNYQQSVLRLHVGSVFRRADGNIIFLVSERSSFFNEGSAKGYEYSDDPLEPEVGLLDTVKLDCGDIFYRLLEGKWSLYLQSYCS